MTVNEIENKLVEAAKRIHPRLIVTVETRPEYCENIEVFANKILVHFKFENTYKLYTTTIDYHLVNKLRARDELEVDMYVNRIVREAFIKLLWHKSTI